jgi:SprT protein
VAKLRIFSKCSEGDICLILFLTLFVTISKREQFIKTLNRFAPEAFTEYLTDLILAAKVTFKIVPGRSTKLGDFRVKQGQEKPTITVNGDLNPYSFLVTAIHELAHLEAFRDHGMRIQAHGIEWKQAYRRLMEPVLLSKQLPVDVEKALWKNFTNTKASSCTDLQLSRTLKQFDVKQGTTLEEIPHKSTFHLNGKSFEKGLLRRSRYLCTELKTGKPYLVHALATVEIMEKYEHK